MGEVALTAEGAFDDAAGRAEVTVDMGSMVDGRMRIVIDGDTTYLDMGGFGALLGDGDAARQLHDLGGVGGAALRAPTVDRDARGQRLWGGTSEIMKVLIARSL